MIYVVEAINAGNNGSEMVALMIRPVGCYTCPLEVKDWSRPGQKGRESPRARPLNKASREENQSCSRD